MYLHMRRSLARSFDHVLARAGHLLDTSPHTLRKLTAGLSAGAPYPPATFGLLTAWLPALLEGRTEEAREILASLEALEPVASRGELVALGGDETAPFTGLYTRLMNAEPGSRTPYILPEKGQVAAFRDQFRSALALLAGACTELVGEIDALVNQVIMVAGDPAGAYQFDGGSCYMLWGGLFINVSLPRTTVALAEVIAHESAHIMLYAMAAEEALVDNPDDELFPSPLRTDLRPMDGIYHATYVSARMHLAMSRLLERGHLDDDQTRQAREAMMADRENFVAGYGVVERHGRLTATGEAVMAGAYDYMVKATAAA